MSPLPKFDNPPVVEVALSISFEALDGYTSAHAGRLWDLLKDEFPRVEEQAELGISIEQPSAPAPPPQFEMVERPHLRTWLQSADGTQLLQIQRNRVVYNWKRGPGGTTTYPSYEVVEQRFLNLLPRVEAFLAESNLGRLVPNQAEVTYVNLIEEPRSRVGDVFRLWQPTTGILKQPEDVRFGARYVIPDDKGGMLGRLLVDLQPAYVASTRTEVLKLDLTARGKPRSPDIDGAVSFLRTGHEWIVTGFAEMTTDEMHSKWKRRRQ